MKNTFARYDNRMSFNVHTSLISLYIGVQTLAMDFFALKYTGLVCFFSNVQNNLLKNDSGFYGCTQGRY